MDSMPAFVDAIQFLNAGANWQSVMSSPSFMMGALIIAFALPATIVALNVRQAELPETSLGQWFGAMPPPDDEPWHQRVRDFSKDGLPDL